VRAQACGYERVATRLPVPEAVNGCGDPTRVVWDAWISEVNGVPIDPVIPVDPRAPSVTAVPGSTKITWYGIDAEGQSNFIEQTVLVDPGTPEECCDPTRVSASCDSGGGGPADDRLSGTDGPDALWGRAGNDRIAAAGGNDVVVPGPGMDRVDAGDGDDIVVLYDVCEAQVGETLDGGSGSDVLVTPVSERELRALGVSWSSFEQVVVDDTNRFAAECR
jgi:hypothetical protein